jgi:hypothetical protein
MASRFTGRDYSTLRTEIIEFLRKKLPKDWNYDNLSDPVVIFAESLARMGDQLHYTIDELRRECDMATAKRASSIYSYAMREGYKMFLPRAARGIISINTTKAQDGLLHLKLSKFDEIKLKSVGESVYVMNDNNNEGLAIDADLHAPIDKNYVASLSQYYNDTSKRSVYQAYAEDVYNKTQHVKVALGTKSEFSFTYNDINTDSTVELPDAFIDRDLVRLSYAQDDDKYKELEYVDDVISSGFNYFSYTLTPKFIGGAITLCIEFPTNYKDIFDRNFRTKFKFEYIQIKNTRVDKQQSGEYYSSNEVDFIRKDQEQAITVVNGHETDQEIVDNGMQYIISVGDGISGYAEYEDANVTRDNYKKYLQNYSALLTKEDYANYIKAYTSSNCKVYDHGDMYKSPRALPEDANLIPRVVYILTDSPYSGRESLWYDLKERSSRSDCIAMIPFGKDPYMIVVKADCYLVGTSAATVASQIEKELLNYYADSIGEHIPKISMIDYLVHKSSDKVVRMNSLILRDSTYGRIDTTFNGVNQLDNQSLDDLFEALSTGDISYESPIEDDTQSTDDYKYYLKGKSYVDSNGTLYSEDEYKSKKEDDPDFSATEIEYLKYSRLTYKSEECNEYNDYPDSFPKLYDASVNSTNPPIITDYTDILPHQHAYGEIDSEDWDVADKHIFGVDNINFVRSIKFTNSENKARYIALENTTYPAYPITAKPADETDTYYEVYDNPTLTNVSETIQQGTPLNDATIGYGGNVKIKSSYIKHHYMVPVLNKVVVLIRAVNSKS